MAPRSGCPTQPRYFAKKCTAVRAQPIHRLASNRASWSTLSLGRGEISQLIGLLAERIDGLGKGLRPRWRSRLFFAGGEGFLHLRPGLDHLLAEGAGLAEDTVALRIKVGAEVCCRSLKILRDSRHALLLRQREGSRLGRTQTRDSALHGVNGSDEHRLERGSGGFATRSPRGHSEGGGSSKAHIVAAARKG